MPFQRFDRGSIRRFIQFANYYLLHFSPDPTFDCLTFEKYTVATVTQWLRWLCTTQTNTYWYTNVGEASLSTKLRKG